MTTKRTKPEAPMAWTDDEIRTGRAAIERDLRPEYRRAGRRWLATLDQRDSRIRELEACRSALREEVQTLRAQVREADATSLRYQAEALLLRKEDQVLSRQPSSRLARDLLQVLLRCSLT